MRCWPGRPQGGLQELQLREEGHRGVEHAGQPVPDDHLCEEVIVGEEPREAGSPYSLDSASTVTLAMQS